MNSSERPPVFELHIRPMFRLLDREHMLTLFGAGVDLWDLEPVWQLRNKILVRLRLETESNMLGLGVGGPWPQEWIDLFERWTQNANEDDIRPSPRPGLDRRPVPGRGRLGPAAAARRDGRRAEPRLPGLVLARRRDARPAGLHRVP